MVNITDEKFDEYVEAGIAAIPDPYKNRIENVAFIVEDEPTLGQRRQLRLACDQTLLGLYEGVPLPARGGAVKLLPDKITIFKKPILAISTTPQQVKEQIRHTVWHEVAHYFGLDHDRIHKLDGTKKAQD